LEGFLIGLYHPDGIKAALNFFGVFFKASAQDSTVTDRQFVQAGLHFFSSVFTDKSR
jgi:hypothetical protein